jgi:RNA polymerase sigma factor (sigma-70 family)
LDVYTLTQNGLIISWCLELLRKGEKLISSNDSNRKKWFLTFFEENESKLIRFVFKMIRNEEVAREIAQDVFVKFWEKFNEKDFGHETEWLFTVARNASYDHLRKKKKIHISHDDLQAELPDLSLQVDEAIEKQQESKALEEKLEQLTDVQKEIIQLKFGEGLNYSEISKVTGLSPNHIAVFVFNIMKKLRPSGSKKDLYETS